MATPEPELTAADLLAVFLVDHEDYLAPPGLMKCSCGNWEAVGAELGALGTAFAFYDHAATAIIASLDAAGYTIVARTTGAARE